MIHNMSTAMVLSLPFSLPDATPIGDRYAMQTRDGITYYFFNLEPFDCHPADDRRAMLLRAAKLQVVSGVRQADIMAAFNISRPIARAVKRYREHGEDAFFEPRRRRGRAGDERHLHRRQVETVARLGQKQNAQGGNQQAAEAEQEPCPDGEAEPYAARSRHSSASAASGETARPARAARRGRRDGTNSSAVAATRLAAP